MTICITCPNLGHISIQRTYLIWHCTVSNAIYCIASYMNTGRIFAHWYRMTCYRLASEDYPNPCSLSVIASGSGRDRPIPNTVQSDKSTRNRFTHHKYLNEGSFCDLVRCDGYVVEEEDAWGQFGQGNAKRERARRPRRC